MLEFAAVTCSARENVKVSLREVEAARRELKCLLERAEKHAEKKTEKNAVKYAALIYLTGARDSKISHLFPKTTVGQRYQWKKRVVDALWTFASPNLKNFLKHAGPYTMRKRDS